jgi:hypothetical protein
VEALSARETVDDSGELSCERIFGDAILRAISKLCCGTVLEK